MTGVVVGVATEPANPLVEAIEIVVTVPPASVATKVVPENDRPAPKVAKEELAIPAVGLQTNESAGVEEMLPAVVAEPAEVAVVAKEAEFAVAALPEILPMIVKLKLF